MTRFSFHSFNISSQKFIYCIKAIIWRETIFKDGYNFTVDSHCLWIGFISLTSSPDTLIIIKRVEKHFPDESITSFPFGNKSPNPNKHKGTFFVCVCVHLTHLPGGQAVGEGEQEQGLHLSTTSTHWGPANNIFPQERTGDRGAGEWYY